MHRHAVSPFDLSRTLPVGGGLLVPYSLPVPPVIKPLMQMVTKGPGQGGRFQSVCFPLTQGALTLHTERKKMVNWNESKFLFHENSCKEEKLATEWQKISANYSPTND